MNTHELEIIRQILRVAILTGRDFLTVKLNEPFRSVDLPGGLSCTYCLEYYAWVLIHGDEYGRDGYNYFGYDRSYRHRDGYDRRGRNERGCRLAGISDEHRTWAYDHLGYDRHGYTRCGRNRQGKPIFEISKDEMLKL